MTRTSPTTAPQPRSLPRRLALVLLAVLFVAGGLVFDVGAAGASDAASGAPRAVGQEPPPEPATTAAGDDGTSAYDDLAGCVSNTGRLLVVLLVDESGSLQATDPTGVRVAAAKTALSGMVGLTQSGGGTAQVDVLVAAFSNRFKPVGVWSTLDRTTLPGLQQTVDTLANRNTGMDTDFINALSGAREALAEQAVTTGETCKAILLFTDGRYDIGVRTNDAQVQKYGDTKPYAPNLPLTNEDAVSQVEKLGVTALCNKDGVADQVRADDIVTLTVALTKQLRPADQHFLEAVTLGKGEGQVCGSRDGTSKGVFLTASDLESLIGTFDAVATRVAGGRPTGPPTEVEACDERACDEGAVPVTIDGSLRLVHLFVKVPTAKSRIEIRAPGVSEALSLSQRTTSAPPFGGGKVQVAWPSPKAATIDIEPAASAAGEWTVTIIDPDGAKGTGSVQVYVFTDVVAKLKGTSAVVVGSPAELHAVIVSKADGKPVTNLKSAVVVAQVTDPVAGRSIEVPLEKTGKDYTGTFTLPKATTTSVLRVVLRLAAVTKDNVKISSVSPQENLNTLKPVGYPAVGPAELRLPGVTGDETSVGTLLIFRSGKDTKPGCVWIGDPSIAAKPTDAGAIALEVKGAGRTEATCAKSPATGNIPVTLTFTPESRASGSVRGAVRVWTQKDGGDEPLPTDIPFSFEMTRGVDTTKQIAIFLGLLVVGIALPVLLLYVMNYVSTRFQAMQYVQAANVPVVVRRSGEVLRQSSAGHMNQLNLYGDDFSSIESSDNRSKFPRKFTWAGLDFVARPPVNPFGEGYAVASPVGRHANVAREGRKVTLSMSLAGSWMFLYDPDATDTATHRILGAVGEEVPPEIHGRLVAFIAKGPVPPQSQRLVEDIHSRLPSTAQRLAELARKSRKSRPTAPAAPAPE